MVGVVASLALMILALGCQSVKLTTVRGTYSAELKDCRFVLLVESGDVFIMAPQ